MINYYEILEIPQSATIAEVKAAFRRLSFKYHPDLNNDFNAEDNFKRVNEAYQILSDSFLRPIYDEKLKSINTNHQYIPRQYKTTVKRKSYLARNVVFIFLFFICLFVIFEISPSFSSVNSINEYRANLTKKTAEYYKNSPERTKQIELISRRANELVEMFRNIPKTSANFN